MRLLKDFVQDSLGRFNLRLKKIALRPMNQFLKERYGNKEVIGVEIGVLGGEHALEMFENLNIKKLYLIDPYLEYKEYEETKIAKRKQKSLVNYEDLARKRLKKYANRIVWIKKFSSDAAKDIKDKVDFVYIDGNHQYEYVKEDIAKYYPLTKEGGVFGGHDYNNYHGAGNVGETFGVVEAVNEFVKSKNKKILFSDADWWIIK